MSAKKLHAIIIFFFLLLSVFLTFGRVGTAFKSFALLTQDLGVYASLAAAQDHPDLFIRDPFLSNEKNVNSYNMLYIPIVKGLEKAFGNYGTACAFLLPFFIFLHLTGYYVLGVTIFKNPWSGLLVALLLSAPTTTSFDFWGLILDALPRFLYQGLIAFVLALSIRYGKNPKWWPVILGGVGILNYVHPLSTPAWILAVGLALWVSAPELSFWEKARNMIVAGFVLLVVLFPFVINYVKSTIVETADGIGYDQTLAILQSRFPMMGGEGVFSPILVFLRGRMNNSFDVIWYLVWLLGLGGIVFALFWRKDSEESGPMRQIAAWIVGIVVVGGFVPIVERIIFAYLRQIPPEFEISRTLRYLVPLILLAAIYSLWMLADYFRQRGSLSIAALRNLFFGMSLFLLIVWGASTEGYRPEFRSAVRQNLSCWAHGQLVCDLSSLSMDFIHVMDVIREKTPVGARIFSEDQEVAIRYYALRPLVFTYKDGAPLAYTDQGQLLIWNTTYEIIEQLTFIRKFPFRHKGFVNGITELAQHTKAEYLLLKEPYKPDLYYPEQLRLMYSNDHYSLFELTER